MTLQELQKYTEEASAYLLRPDVVEAMFQSYNQPLRNAHVEAVCGVAKFNHLLNNILDKGEE